ncbi:MAG TPA: hypothetical protein VF401_02200 [Candidatus Saccharimonadales bacterium]
MSYTPNNPNGQAASANSAPVVLASDQSKIPIQVTNGQTLSTTGTAGALNADAYTGDVSNYSSVSVQIQGTWSGTLSFQCSNDNTNWVAATLFSASSLATSGSQSVTANGVLHGPLPEQYFRIRMTSYTSGTASVNILLKTMQIPLHSVGASYSPLTRTSGGLTGARIKSAATTNATVVKASTAGLYGFCVSNDHATSKRYIKFYNKATAPTVGTDTPVFTLLIPPSSTVNVPMSDAAVSTFPSGMAYAITGAITDADTTAIGADEVHGLIWYG